MGLTAAALQQIINTGDFQLLVGQVENGCFDCKSQPYQVQHDFGKRELAKDVSSFANGNGGVIFIGISTTRTVTHFGDEVEEIRPFTQRLVNTAQYRDIIKAWIYPEPEGVTVEWIPVKTDPTRGIVIVNIPAQKESLRPFLIVKTLDASRQVEIVFGYAQRISDSSQPLSVVDLQRMLRSGFNYENQLKGQLESIEALLRHTTEHNQAAAEKRSHIGNVESRIEKALAHDDMSSKRTIVLSAYPDRPTELRTIFTSTENSIRTRLERPPILRHGGWTLETLDQAKIVRGEMIRVVNGNRKLIDLYRDGTLIFAGLADEDFLCWGYSGKKKINPLAIVEVVYSFANFYKLVLDDFGNPSGEVSFRVDFRNMHLDGVKNYLLPYHLNHIEQMFGSSRQEAPDDHGTIVRSFTANEYAPATMAYEILREIYLWFGFDEDKIPYTKTENGLKLVSAEAIRAAG